ncbi:hypothetical protein [Microvirga sp. VF16]|uniref:hypothetical protein n=1 Tax=Microvirga sp. VF16 TaxID=2807101 RepID=UPI00193E355D|nr:hypothetical protein [Microvirga sp. VF16]QRM35371.1 hypothetical protein JO965_44195 [Microvirga sp. VF16]
MAQPPGSAFVLVSHWRVPGDIGAAFGCLGDPEIARWWPEAYREVREIFPGDAEGCGRVLDILTRSRIPYPIRWRLEVIEVRRPEHLVVRASGDLAGEGVWELRQRGAFVAMTYTWCVEVTKPWMQWLTPVLRPFFAANHHWVMRRGEIGLTRELARLDSQAHD